MLTADITSCRKRHNFRARSLHRRSLPTRSSRMALLSTTQARQPEAGKTPHGAEQPNELTKHHVLLVDDVDDVLVSVGAFLVKEGYAVHKAASGDEALRLIASESRELKF